MKIQRIIWNPHGLSGGVGDGEPRHKFSNWAQNLLAPALFPVQTLVARRSFKHELPWRFVGFSLVIVWNAKKPCFLHLVSDVMSSMLNRKLDHAKHFAGTRWQTSRLCLRTFTNQWEISELNILCSTQQKPGVLE